MSGGCRKAMTLLLLGLAALAVPARDDIHWEALVLAGNQWYYRANNSAPPAGWYLPGFDASSWSKGPGGIGYGDNDDATVIGSSPSLFLLCRFLVSDASAISAATLWVDFDDAFVAYLNGTEIARANIGTPGTPPAWNGYALSCDYEARLPGGDIPADFPLADNQLSLLRNGENLLALQVHNCNASSSDLSSTTFLLAAINGPVNSYQPLPSWFTPPVNAESHLPLVVINSSGQNIPNEPKLDVGFRVIDNGPGALNKPGDPGNRYDGYAGMEVRGQSSQMFPKKSYGLELRNLAGEEVKAPLLGMPEESDWVLYAPYSDKTLLRNAITFSLGCRTGRWQPRYRFCELYLNGSYQGVYQLTERIKRDKNRVDIAKMEAPDIAGDAVTGGYIVKVDKTQDLASTEYFYSYPDIRFSNARAYAWSWYYPGADALVPAQRTWFSTFIRQAENALNGSSFTHPATGYAAWFDIPSFIDFQIINELSNNVDGYRYSTFFHKDRDSEGGKLAAGPLWDFDLCYGNVDYSPRNLAVNQWCYTNYGSSEGNCMHWWARLMQDPGYVSQLKQRWSLLRRGPFRTDSVMALIDTLTAHLGPATDRNFTRWPILDSYVWPNSAVRNSHAAEISFLKDWITRRMAWMDSQWLVPLTGSPSGPLAETRVYPNPCAGILTIALPRPAGEVSALLTDIRGVQLLKRNFAGNQGAGLQLDLSGLQEGFYLLQLSCNGIPFLTTRIVRQEN